MRSLSCLQRLPMAAVLASCAGLAFAQATPPRIDLGQIEYQNQCAVCHGRDGKGNGPYVELLRRSPPDLTLMARRNGGVFPLSQVYEVIDGAGAGHGGREMPIWGRAYSMQAADYYGDMPYDSAAVVRGRILALAEYLNRLQQR